MSLNTKHKGRGFWFGGVRGTGKTTLFCKFAREYPADHLLLFDHKGEFAERLKSFNCWNIAQCEKAWQAGKAVLFNPTKEFPGIKTLPNGKEAGWGRQEAFVVWCRWAWQKIQENPYRIKLFGWDESGQAVPVSASYNSHPCRPIVEEGRVYGCDLLWTSQQFNQANNQLRQQATDVFAFRQEDETAMEWLISKGFKMEALRDLRDGDYFYKSNRAREIVASRVELSQ